MTRDKFIRLGHKLDHALDVTARDVRNRTYGLWAEMKAYFTADGVSDAVLVERVRAALGEVVSHPGSIEVSAERGRVALQSPVLAHEVASLLKRVASLWGVREVEESVTPSRRCSGPIRRSRWMTT